MPAYWPRVPPGPMSSTMRQIWDTDSDVLELRGELRFAHVLTSGAFLGLAALIWLHWLPLADVPLWLQLTVPPVACVTAFMTLGWRWGTTINRREQTVCRWWGIWTRLHETTVHVRPTAVRLGRSCYADDSVVVRFFHEIYVISELGPPVLVGRTSNALRGWALATSLGEFLAVPVEDRSAAARWRAPLLAVGDMVGVYADTGKHVKIAPNGRLVEVKPDEPAGSDT